MQLKELNNKLKPKKKWKRNRIGTWRVHEGCGEILNKRGSHISLYYCFACYF